MKLPKVLQVVGDEPISVDECRQHLEAQRYDDTTVDDLDDAMIEGFRDAAIDHCERFTGLSFSTKLLELALDTWPTVSRGGTAAIELPLGPVREVREVRTGQLGSSDSSDANLVDPASYVLDDFVAVAALKPVTAWPPVTEGTNMIRIQYLAGYGVDSDGGEALPRGLRAAVLLVMGHLYKNREASSDKVLAEIPVGVETLLRHYRVRWGFA